MTKTTEIIIIREKPLDSLMSNASTFSALVALIGIGVWLESTAMQWVGAMLAFLTITGKAFGGVKRLTVEQARKRLDEIEAEAA